MERTSMERMINEDFNTRDRRLLPSKGKHVFAFQFGYCEPSVKNQWEEKQDT